MNSSIRLNLPKLRVYGQQIAQYSRPSSEIARFARTHKNSYVAQCSNLHAPECFIQVRKVTKEGFQRSGALRLAKVERAFHMAFGPYRINPGREFFEIEPEQAITLLQLMITEDVTPELQEEASDVDVESQDAVKRLKARRPSLNYFEMGLQEGSILEFVQGNHACEVISGRRVKFKDEDISLTALTKQYENLVSGLCLLIRYQFQSRIYKISLS